ncbi:hypothetical protein BHF70_02020 [Anaerostipes sp. 494a]|uniref:serine/threonine-protein kinase n=1 Tax=Anaerostipes sp. 494a TaxID=1261636 RepID=UPI0009510140|nr:serine/threonine-protein kinase [Anaerostipes sp. 494a]OLR58503.1 hypothetical protein BHF70_02020 [Anaerostipes sp. 494a]
MTIEEEYQLSCYDELTPLDESGKVYLVKQKDTGEIFVKKTTSWYSKEVYQQIMGNHIKGIPEVYHIYCDQANAIIIEEYIHGRNLEQFLKNEGPLDEDTAAKLMLDLCKILDQIHHLEVSVIHRDIKPLNIMISNEGTLYLIDFNAARNYEPGQSRDTELLGTEEYAAPEQYGFGQSDARSDIYAAGITFHRMMTGKFPHEKAPSGKYRKIIEKCIKLDVNSRYQDVRELQKDIQISMGIMKKKRNILNFPGFRSGHPVKMISAVFGYFFLGWFCFTIELTDVAGNILTGKTLWLQRSALFLCFFISILFCSDYMDIKTIILGKWKDKKPWSWLLQILIVFLIVFIFAGIMSIME